MVSDTQKIGYTRRKVLALTVLVALLVLSIILPLFALVSFTADSAFASGCGIRL